MNNQLYNKQIPVNDIYIRSAKFTISMSFFLSVFTQRFFFRTTFCVKNLLSLNSNL